MLRRLHVPNLLPGRVLLASEPAHHARDVLRLTEGQAVELFDDAGQTATATLVRVSPAEVVAMVDDVRPPAASLGLTIASAIPKGPRADWMIEKLSEIGVDRFIPLATRRAVVLPEGTGKASRWQRLAIEAARQSRRPGTMQLDSLTPLAAVVQSMGEAAGFYAATEEDGKPLPVAIADTDGPIVLCIGPEGGWADDERTLMHQNGLMPVTLGPTILRTETAALVAAGIVAACRGDKAGWA